jgi:hypothetical protein
LDNVHSLLDTLFRREAKMVTVQKYHITAVKQIQIQLDSQQKQLDSFVNLTTTLYKALSRAKNRTETTTGALLVHNDFLNAVGMFKTSIMGHKQILTSLDRGYIDTDLVPSKNLQDALLQIRDKIPAGFQLIYDPVKTSLLPYYNLKLASRISGSTQIRGMLQVPLTGLTDDFVLYKSIPFPSPFGINQERRFMLKDSERYIALSTDQRKFIDLGSTFNQALCMNGPTLICPATAPVITEPTASCIFHIISGKMKNGLSKTKCKLIEVKTDEVYIQAVDSEEWAISSPKPTIMQPKCIDLEASNTPLNSFTSIEVQGNLMVNIPRQCTVNLDHHIIPMRLLMTSDLGQMPSRLNVPPLHGHALLDLHGSQIIEDKIDTELTNVFQQILQEYHNNSLTQNATSKEVHKLMTKMIKENQDISKIQPSFHHQTWFGWLSIVFWIFCFIGIVTVFFWVKRQAHIQGKPEPVARYSATRRGGKV